MLQTGAPRQASGYLWWENTRYETHRPIYLNVKVSLAALWSGPALSPYHERSPNSEAEFLASFWPKGGAGWNALRARRARALRWNRDCSTHARHGQIARHNTSLFCDITDLAKFRHLL